MSSALILAAGFRLQYRTLRCAAEIFNRCYVAGPRAAKAIAWSRWCRRFWMLPGEKSGFDEDLVTWIDGLCQENGIACVLPSDGETTRFLATHRARISTRTYPLPAAEVFELLDNKATFIDLCASLDVPHPRTQLARDKKDLLERLERGELGSRVVVKPLGMWGSFGVHAVTDENRVAVMAQIAYEPILMQEFVTGYDASIFLLCRAGKLWAHVAYTKTPERLIFVQNDLLLANALRIAEHLRFDGVIGFDARIQPGGGVRFIECNPRFWYNMDIVSRAGLNFVALGLAAAPPAGAPLTIAGLSICRPWRMMRTLGLPWEITRADLATAGYYSRDMLPSLVMLTTRFSPAGRSANGRGL